MARDWEAQLRHWAKAPTEAERLKMDNAESQIREAIRASSKLRDHDIEVFAQGSYANRTNVPRESDVDVCVMLKSAFGLEWQGTDGFPITDLALIASMRSQLGIVDAVYEYRDFKQDVLAAFAHRRYWRDPASGRINLQEGTKFYPDSGGEVVNFPKQQYANGVSMNEATGRRLMTLLLRGARFVDGIYIPADNELPPDAGEEVSAA